MTVAILLVLFFIKNKTIFENSFGQNSGISSGEIKLADLVNADSDMDGILNWEEGVWGTNPTKKDTDDDGIEDGAEIAKLKTERGLNSSSETTERGSKIDGEETLTQTDKFSRELFTAVAALDQAGELDQASAEKLSESLANQVKNSVQRKVFLISQLKTTSDNSAPSMQTYVTSIDTINKKYPVDGNVLDILKEFVNDGEDVEVEALSKLDTIIKQKSSAINDFSNMTVPTELAQLHAEMINAMQRLVENLSDIQLFEVDPIVAMGAISTYEKNVDILDSTLTKLSAILVQKLNN